jgi:Ca2+-binding RTX toxin-like protein
VDALETRLTPAVTVTPIDVNGILLIESDGAADRVWVNATSGGDVTVAVRRANNIVHSESSANLLQVQFNGGNGNDIFNARNVAAAFRVFAFGEGDDDRLIGGQGDDELDGGLGNDGLIGNQGADVLFGRENDDVLRGGDGDDTLLGGEGNDFLGAAAGNDYLDGDLGDDTLRGWTGNDTLFGSGGADSFRAGAGQDELHFDSSDLALFGGRNADRFVNLDMTADDFAAFLSSLGTNQDFNPAAGDVFEGNAGGPPDS